MTAAIALVAGQAIRDHRMKAAHEAAPTANEAALLLSGGGNLGFFHLGVIRALRAGGLLPRVLSGASAGSIMAAIVATRTDGELGAIDADELGFVGFTERQANDVYDAAQLGEDVARAIPDVTFAEAQEISGRALNIALAGRFRGGVLCGPRTTPNVLVRDAVRASCAVPFVFEPVVVRERRRGTTRPFRNGAQWIDGSLFADVPSAAIKRRYGVSRTIVSLVNPLVRPFLAERPSSRGMLNRMTMGATRWAALGWARMCRFSTFAMPKAHDALDLVCRVIEQPYGGDLVLTPSKRFAGRDVLAHPTAEMVHRLAADGEGRTRERLGELAALAA